MKIRSNFSLIHIISISGLALLLVACGGGGGGGFPGRGGAADWIRANLGAIIMWGLVALIVVGFLVASGIVYAIYQVTNSDDDGTAASTETTAAPRVVASDTDEVITEIPQNPSLRLYAEEGTGVKFSDVASYEEVLEELQEVVEFLRNPGRFSDLGGRLPKGVLLVGSPGTGLTMKL